MTRIEEKGSIVLNNKEHYPLGNALLILKEGFMEGNLMLGGKRVVRQPCLTEAEFDDAVARSKTAYEAAMAVRAKEKAAHDASMTRHAKNFRASKQPMRRPSGMAKRV